MDFLGVIFATKVKTGSMSPKIKPSGRSARGYNCMGRDVPLFPQPTVLELNEGVFLQE